MLKMQEFWYFDKREDVNPKGVINFNQLSVDIYAHEKYPRFTYVQVFLFVDFFLG